MPMHSAHAALTTASDLAACRALLSGGSRTFFAASHVLPRRVSDPATALYAFCRLADDAVDLEGGKLAALARLRRRLDLAYRGYPLPNPVDRAFAAVVQQHSVPRSLPEALLEGLEWDACGRRYEDISDLRAYAARVAGTVGAMMAVVMGTRDDDVLARACDLGVAMQLTNIARDVGEDARNGRLYLPRRWMRDEGIDPDEWLARPSFSRPLAAVVRRLLAHADELYQRADAGIACLPSLCRPGIRAARRLYAEIGHEVARRGFDSVSGRAVVPPGRKIRLLARSVVGFPHSRDLQQAPALDEVQFLVEAAAGSQTARSAGSRSRSLETRIIWVLALFERLERREQMSGGT